jgi:YHS domain-containing protein
MMFTGMMSRPRNHGQRGPSRRWATVVVVVASGGLAGAWTGRGAAEEPGPADHPHAAAAHGGLIVPIGGHFHVEAVFEKGGMLRLHTLGQDESIVMPVETQVVRAYARPADGGASEAFTLTADPQPGDGPGTTSRFSGRLPDGLADTPVIVSVPSLAIGRGRFRAAFSSQPAPEPPPAMPAGVSGAEEARLYLEPQGKYTEADILANGPLLPAAKFRGVRSVHDFNPRPGDRICPVTRTKANPAFAWVIDGQTYTFCCPPCIDEFVAAAKERPESIQAADSYVKDPLP